MRQIDRHGRHMRQIENRSGSRPEDYRAWVRQQLMGTLRQCVGRCGRKTLERQHQTMLAGCDLGADSNKVSVGNLTIIYPEPYGYIIVAGISDIQYESHSPICFPVPRKRAGNYPQSRVCSISRESHYDTVATSLNHPSASGHRVTEGKINNCATCGVRGDQTRRGVLTTRSPACSAARKNNEEKSEKEGEGNSLHALQTTHYVHRSLAANH